MYLIDTSVWIELFRRPASTAVEAIPDLEEVVICLPILQEVLQGFRDERDFRIADEALHALPIVEAPLRTEVFEQAVACYRLARRAGVTVRLSVDCLIAVCAMRNDLVLLHHDRDFNRLANLIPLRVRDVEPLH